MTISISPHQQPIRATCSFGVASTSSELSEISALIAAADAALYQAKREGRNRVHPAPFAVHDEERGSRLIGARIIERLVAFPASQASRASRRR